MLTLYDRFIFLIEETLAGLRRNGLMSLAAISTAGVALALFGGFAIAAYNLRLLIDSLPDKFEMRVVMKNEATDKQIDDVEKRIQAIKDAYTLEHQTKEENWKKVQQEYKETVGDLSDLENPLPDTFTLKVKDLKRSEAIAGALLKMPAVEHVAYLKQEQQAALKITQFVRITGLAISGALCLAAMVLIYNATRLTVIARRREIRVMQMVGATTQTIRIPFVLEAIIQGMLGGILAAIMLWLAARPLVDLINQIPGFHVSLTTMALWLSMSLLMVCGAALGSVCGLFAVHKFLKV